MIERAVAAGVAFGWVAGDEVYGDNGPLRAWLEERDIAHVLAVACRHRVPAGAGPALRPDELAARLPKTGLAAAPGRRGRQGKALLGQVFQGGPQG
jgi:SRSO17 transposase